MTPNFLSHARTTTLISCLILLFAVTFLSEISSGKASSIRVISPVLLPTKKSFMTTSTAKNRIWNSSFPNSSNPFHLTKKSIFAKSPAKIYSTSTESNNNNIKVNVAIKNSLFRISPETNPVPLDFVSRVKENRNKIIKIKAVQDNPLKTEVFPKSSVLYSLSPSLLPLPSSLDSRSVKKEYSEDNERKEKHMEKETLASKHLRRSFFRNHDINGTNGEQLSALLKFPRSHGNKEEHRHSVISGTNSDSRYESEHVHQLQRNRKKRTIEKQQQYSFNARRKNYYKRHGRHHNHHDRIKNFSDLIEYDNLSQYNHNNQYYIHSEHKKNRDQNYNRYERRHRQQQDSSKENDSYRHLHQHHNDYYSRDEADDTDYNEGEQDEEEIFKWDSSEFDFKDKHFQHQKQHHYHHHHHHYQHYDDYQAQEDENAADERNFFRKNENSNYRPVLEGNYSDRTGKTEKINSFLSRNESHYPILPYYEDSTNLDTNLRKSNFTGTPSVLMFSTDIPSSLPSISPLLSTAFSMPFDRNEIKSRTKVFRSLPADEYELQQQQQLQPYGLHWPVKREAIVEGDVILGGLMMVHSREDTIMCGPIMPQGGIQALEAMLYTLDRINEAGLFPNISLGAHILDDCDKDSYGLEMAVDFIKGSISNIDDAEYHCNKTQVRKVISGVVGAASSVTSIQVANLLRLFRIPQVSFFSTSPELSNKQRFEYFSRTIPSDHYQVKAMVEIVKRMGWSYVSIIYEESNYGIKAFEELEELLAKHNVCIAIKEKLVKDSGVAEEIAYDNIVHKLLTKPRARGAIIFGSDQEVAGVMRAVRRNNATGAFSWIGSDGWSARNLVSDGNEPEVEGTLSVQPQANPVKGFESYFLNLTVENNQRNPWFVEFWEDHFQCRYPNSSATPYNTKYTRMCTTKEMLTRNNTDFEDQLQFVSDAVMAFAYALRDMHRDLCGGRPTLCDVMKPTKGADLLKYLRKVEFEGLSGDHFRFDANGDGPARYNIIHFKQVEYGKYRWVKVGEYYEGELRLNMSEVQFKLHQPKPPESVCSLPCERGQAKKYVEGESCCWHCFNCSMYQIRHPHDETQCLTCRKGTLPDRMKEFCQEIPEVYLKPDSGWAIGAMAFSSTGMLITLFVVGVFLKHHDTPVVRASGRELSYILLAGILMCYLVTFALIMRPTDAVCGIQRFGAGFCFTVVYAALLTKTNRIARIFKAGKQSAKRPSFISPKSQLVICACLTFIQILINGVWMVISPSHAIYHYPTREDNLLVCDSYIDASYMIAFFYPILLIIVCTVYAVLTRKIPEAFNESKHIGFTMYTTCVIWLAFVPLYFGTGNHVSLRITSMSVTISLSASVTVACLFSPKLYIILIRPERNVRQSMMPARYSAINRGTGTGPSSVMAAAMVTAATCNQEEKINKHISPSQTATENGRIKLCEMATQTVNISSIFTNIDSNALAANLNSIPYADQSVPNSIENNYQISNNTKSLNQSPKAVNAIDATTVFEPSSITVVNSGGAVNDINNGSAGIPSGTSASSLTLTLEGKLETGVAISPDMENNKITDNSTNYNSAADAMVNVENVIVTGDGNVDKNIINKCL